MTAALDTIIAKYETERRQHCGQVEALQKRVEQQASRYETPRQPVGLSRQKLAEHMTHLDTDYGTLVAMCREPWN